MIYKLVKNERKLASSHKSTLKNHKTGTRQLPFFHSTMTSLNLRRRRRRWRRRQRREFMFCDDHSLPLLLLLLFNDFVGLQCHPLLVHQLLSVQLPAGLHCQPLLIGHEQLAALRRQQQRETIFMETHCVQWGSLNFLPGTPKPASWSREKEEMSDFIASLKLRSLPKNHLSTGWDHFYN